MASPSESRPYAPRIDAVRVALSKSGRRAPLDALVVTDLTNIGYLTGFAGSTAIVVITQEAAMFITDGRYTAMVAGQMPEYEIVEARGSGGYNEALATALAGQKAARVGFESGNVTVDRLTGLRKAAPGFRWVAAPGIPEKLRLIKDESEIAAMREAARIAEGAFAAVQERIRPGVSERDFALELEYAMRRMGAESPSFDTIVASGENGAHPHHIATERQFQAGDLVTVDWGAKFKGYCSDITRTVAVPGKAVDSTLVKIHGIVLEAMNRAIDACTPRANGKAVDAVARDIISAAGYGDGFKHSLGHSLGLDVHDGHTLSQRADKVTLLPGTVTTVEPGIYIDGLGGVRIEEDVLVTEDGPVTLTTRSGGL